MSNKSSDQSSGTAAEQTSKGQENRRESKESVFDIYGEDDDNEVYKGILSELGIQKSYSVQYVVVHD